MSAVAQLLTSAFSPCGAMVKHGNDVTVFRCHECVCDSRALCACLLHALAHARTIVGVVRTYSADGVLIATRTNAEVRRVVEVEEKEAEADENEEEAEAYDATIADLVARGWLESKPRMVAVDASDPSRGRYAAWDATEKGRAEWKP